MGKRGALTILFVEGGLPSPQVDAGSVANLDLIELLQSQGNRVMYLYTGHNSVGSMQSLRAIGCQVVDGTQITQDQQASWIALNQLDLAILSRPGPAMQWLGALQKQAIPIVYFGHDVHHQRLLRANTFISGQSQVAMVHKAIEQYLWRQVDVVVYPTAWECQLVEHTTPGKRAVHMPLYAMGALESARKSFDLGSQSGAGEVRGDPYRLLFVGGSRHAPNGDGLLWFIQSVAPQLKMPFQLTVIGHWEAEAGEQLLGASRRYFPPSASLILAGCVSDAQLHQQYQESDLVIAPLRFGAGLKRKVVEAVMLERPILTTPIGIEGIDLPPTLCDYLSCEVDAVQFSGRIAECLTLPRAELEERSHQLALYVGEQFSEERRLDSLAQIFAMLGLS